MAINAIVTENLLAGAPQSEWKVDANGIEGFATDISVAQGSRVDFKINADFAGGVEYKIEIYRLGYYGGDGARLVTTIETDASGNQLLTVDQPDPIVTATEARDVTGAIINQGTLVDAGNWSVSAGWDVPADATSGVYIAVMKSLDGNLTNHLPFIVRDTSTGTEADPKSDIVFQTSDTTWQAYNTWGGANFYGGNTDVVAPGFGSGRAYMVSYNRPITTDQSSGEDYLFGAEYAAIYWLEKNGYDVSYIAGVDTDRLGAANLIGHDAFLSVGHDEYWSGDQRANVEAARDAGVNLAFMSGNEVYWKVRWETSTFTNPDGSQGSYRTLVCYKETWANSDPNAAIDLDPSDIWTGTWRDPRGVNAGGVPSDGGRPENGLTGTIFGPDGNSTGEPITVPADLAQLRVWNNVTRNPDGTITLPDGILGYEWDLSPESGPNSLFRPEGLIELSRTTADWPRILTDFGNTTAPGTEVHNLTLYRAESGALVFGAGTVFWSWGLANALNTAPYGNPLETDIVSPAVQQFTVNLLAEMGIQPGSLEAGLIVATRSLDVTAPTTTLAINGDSDGAATVSAGQTVIISGLATDNDNNAATTDGRVAAVEVSTDGGQTWRVASGAANAVGEIAWTYAWTPSAAGSATVIARAIDDSVNLSFATSALTASTSAVTVDAPTSSGLYSAAPGGFSSDTNDYELGTRFTVTQGGTITELRYYRGDVDAQDEDTRTLRLWNNDGSQVLASGSVSSVSGASGTGWQVLTLDTQIAVTAGTSYVVSYSYDGVGIDQYAYEAGFFNAPVSGPGGVITAPAGAGIFNNDQGLFPNTIHENASYFVDVTFVPFSGTNTPPQITSNGGDTPDAITINENTTLVTTVTATDGDVPAQPLTYSIIGGEDAALFTINATNGALSFVSAPNFEALPNDGLTEGYQVTVQVSDSQPGGTDTQTLTVNVADVVSEPASTSSVLDGEVPAVPGYVVDGNDYELGMRFTASQNGLITQLQYFRLEADSADQDVRTLTLWNATAGLALGSVIVTSDAGATGWQYGTLGSAINIQAGTTYVVSYGYDYDGVSDQYASQGSPFNSPNSSPDGILTAPMSAGVYGTLGTLPSSVNGNSSNYWVDVTFTPQLAPNTPPVITSNGGDTPAPVTINENTTLVTTVTATDGDVPAQSLTYSIAGGEDAALFTITATSGALSFISAPDFEALPNAGTTLGYQVTVQVSDGQQGGTDTQALTVNVADVLENPQTGGFDGQQIRVDYVFGAVAGVPATDWPGTTAFVTVNAAPNTPIEVAAIPDAAAIGNGPFGLANIDFGASSFRIEFPLDEGVFPGSSVNFATEADRPYNGVLISDTSGALPVIRGVTIVNQAGFSIPLVSGNISFTGDSIFVNVNDLTDAVSGQNSRSTDVDALTSGRQASFVVLDVDFNDAPVVTGIADRSVAEDEELTYFVSAPFSDADAGDTLLYEATLANGEPLPDWLTFNSDGDDLIFTGTPANGDVGVLLIKVTAIDDALEFVSTTFTLTVTPVNDPPELANPISNQTVAEDTALNFTVPANTFRDVDVGDTLLYEATLANGDPLPTWLSFDEGTRTFSGTPLNEHVGPISIMITAMDAALTTVSTTFTLTVTNTNDAPVGQPAIDGVLADEQILTAQTTGISDQDGLTGTFSYQWQRNGSNIFGATGQTYAVSDDDVGAAISVVVSFTDLGGQAEQVSSTATALIGNGFDIISGTDGADSHMGGGDVDYLFGRGGSDVLNGGAGGDHLWGGLGADQHIGGDDAGIDYARYDDANYSDLTLDLNDPGQNVGSVAVGDTYTGIEGLVGGAGIDTIYGDSGNNFLFGVGSNDFIYGRAGNDYLNGGAGGDYLSGDEGVDFLLGSDGDDELVGGAGGDHLWGGLGADQHIGGDDAGIDYARYDDANYGDLTLDLNDPGQNVGSVAVGDTYTGIEGLVGGAGVDTIYGNADNNFLFGVGSNDFIYGRAGIDYLNGGIGGDYLDGGAGGDHLWGGLGADQHIGGDDAGIDYARYDDANYGDLTLDLNDPGQNVGSVAVGDTYTGIEGLVGGAGIDTIYGNASGNFLFGGGSNDFIYGRAGNDYLNGGIGGDYLDGGTGGDHLWGGLGADQHIGGDDAGIDYARYDDADHGNLTIRLDQSSLNIGNAAAGDSYIGIEGLVGGVGNDAIFGNASDNFLFGGGGVDVIDAGLGNDYLNGGAGADQFVFSSALNAATNVDRIADFEHGVDTIVLSAMNFGALGASLDADEFAIGAAQDDNDYILYDFGTGELFYDADGSGAGGVTMFARVSAGTVLDAGDFITF